MTGALSEPLTALVVRLEETIAAQQQVIDSLVGAAERRTATVAELGTQHVVEQRTARLHSTERLLRSVIEALEGALCIVGADGRILDANRRWLDLVQPSTDPDIEVRGADRTPGAVGSDFFEWCRTADGMHDLLVDAAALVQAVVGSDQGRSCGPEADRSVRGRVQVDGRTRSMLVRVHPVNDHATARAVVSVLDITAGMETREQLRAAVAEAQRQALAARATDNAVVITSPDSTIEWVNDPFTQATGYSLDEARGRLRGDLVHGACRNTPELADFLTLVARGERADGEFLTESRDRRAYWANIQVRPVVEEGRITHLVWVEEDVTVRRDTQRRLGQAVTRSERLAAALSQETKLLTGVLSAVPHMVFWKDGSGRYLGCNTSYLAFRGLQDEWELLGRDEDDLSRQDDMTAVLLELEPLVMTEGEAVVDRKVDLRDSQGRLRSLLLSVLPLDDAADGHRGVIGVGADITHSSELERQLAQASRLESIGQLASGIAHEINTPIQYVADNTSFLAEAIASLLTTAQQIQSFVDGAHGQDAEATLREVTALLEPLELDFLGAEVPGALTESREGLARVTDIIRAMKVYAHPGTGRADMDVNRAISSTVAVCRNEWKYDAVVDLDLAPDVGLAPCFEGELKQVVLNMVVNAAQAIAEGRDGRSDAALGRITVSTRRTSDELLIVIADDGPGMDEHVSRRVFDPFFTTKEIGRGTGQGLGLAHTVVVTKHQGRIDLDTAPGRGTTFTLHLPLHVPDHGDGSNPEGRTS